MFTSPNPSRHQARAPDSRFGTPSIPGRASRSGRNIRATQHDAEHNYDMESERSTDAAYLAARCFVKRPELSVISSGQLPLELKNMINTADLHQEAYSGHVDVATNFSFVVSSTTCYVWNSTQNLTGSSTCYILPVPVAACSATVLPPATSLVPYGGTREPGLIVISATGEVRFWESIGTGLAGAERFISAQITLVGDELITGLYRCDNLVYIASSTFGRLFRLTVSTTGGKTQIIHRTFTRSQNVFARITSTLFSAGEALTDDVSIVAVAISGETIRQGKEVWALSERHLQKWRVSLDSLEQLEVEYDMKELLGPQVFDRLRKKEFFSRNKEMEFLDVGVTFDNQLLILLAYAEEPNASTSASPPRRTYAVAQLSFDGGIADVKDFDILVRNKERDPRPSTSPKMSLIDGGAAVLIHFGDAITVASLSDGATFRDTLNLKSSWDRTLGFGHVRPPGEEAGSVSEIAILTADSGVLMFKVDEEKIKDFHADTPTNQIKSTLEQGIFFGAMLKNPFSFSLSLPLEGSLDTATSSLSQEILGGRSVFMRPILDIRAQLEARYDLLRRLRVFINENGGAGQLSASARKSLSVDMEKLAAAKSLWVNLPEYPGSRTLVAEVIEMYYAKNPNEFIGVDRVRTFFKNQIDHLGIMVSGPYNVVRASQTRRGSKVVLTDISRIILTILDTVFRHRNDTQDVYPISPDDPTASRVPSWTSDGNQIDVLQDLYDATALLIPEHGREASWMTRSNETIAAEGSELRQQLKDLASALFYLYKEKILYAQRLATENGDDGKAKELQEKFTKARSDIADRLVLNQCEPNAFALAEMYQDFDLLVSLCNRRTEQKEKVINHYIHRFGDAFAFPLFHWYLKNGQTAHLMRPDHEHVDLVTQFFKKFPNPSISWINSVDVGDFKGGADALFTRGETENDILTRETILSIGKLMEIAGTKYTDHDLSRVTAFDDQLDIIGSQKRTLEQFQAFVKEYRSRPTHLSDIEIITDHFTTATLRNRPAFTSIFKRVVREVIKNQVLQPEDLVDLTTLKRNDQDTNGFIEAFTVIFRIYVGRPPGAVYTNELEDQPKLPPGRCRAALQTVWRRAFVYDDWETLRRTSDLLDNLQNTALYRFIKYALSLEELPEGMLLSPREAVGVPFQSELNARFSGFTPDQMEALVADYEWEQRRLESMIQGDVGLTEIYDAIVELAASANAAGA